MSRTDTFSELHDLDMLKPVAATLDHAVMQLKKLFDRYADMLKNDHG